MRDDTASILFFSIGAIGGLVSAFFYRSYSEYYKYEKDARNKDIDDVKSLLEREHKNLEEFKQPEFDGKMVYVSGIAVASGRYTKGDGAYSKVVNTPPSSLIACNPKNEVAYKLYSKPRHIMTVDHLRMKSRNESNFYDLAVVSETSPFILVDSHDESINVIPTGDTILYATRFQRSRDVDIIRGLLALNNLLVNKDENRYSCERLKNILYEGDIVTIGGFLYYNFASDSLEIRNVNVITGGGQQNMIQYFKEWKTTYGALFTFCAGITLVLAGFGAYFMLRYRKNKINEQKRLEFQNAKRQIKNVPDDECCIVCMESRRDVIL